MGELLRAMAERPTCHGGPTGWAKLAAMAVEYAEELGESTRHGPCWLWPTAQRNGYAQILVDGGCRAAHRAMYELLVAPIPEGLVIDHLCLVKRCVNPAHLEPVTVRENNERAIAAGLRPVRYKSRRQSYVGLPVPRTRG